MARRWTDPTAFRPDPDVAQPAHPSRRQSVALLAVLLLVAGAIAVVSYAVTPDRARSFDLLHGSVLIADKFGPVNVDLPSGRGTLQIRGADEQAGVTSPGDLAVVPFDGGTMLLNRRTGEFNMVDPTGFVLKRDGGVSIPGRSGDTSATGIAAGQSAFIERTAPTGTDVLLVGLSTVETAADAPRGTAASVKPRAGYTTRDGGSTAAGGAASANGELWALFRGSRGTVVRQLSLPAASSTGATLTATDHGTVGSVAALESATTGSDGSGPDVVAVASPGSIRLFTPGAATRTVPFRAPTGTDSILPTSNAHGRLSYLVHSTTGWSMVSVATDATGLVGPVALGAVEPGADLAPPAASLGATYTMLRNGTSGTVYRIAADGRVTAAAADYPQTERDGRSVEAASFSDGYLIARGPRVIVDSPAHYLALTVFSDGSRAPRVIEKANLTSVNASAGAEALTRGLADSGTPTTKSPDRPRAQPAPQANPKINCRQANQKPHIPRIDGVEPASRSVQLSWFYQAIAAQDCLPRTYVVSLGLISNDAPSAPGQVVIQGQTDAVITGLFPSTTYAVTVTAYINKQHTSSQTVRFTTGKEGPAPPTALTVVADNAGNWDLAWDRCGSGSCVPADSWTVIPSFCDSRGISSSPAPFSLPADPTSLHQSPYTFKGGAALLGRGLQFRVEGKSDDGTTGSPTALSACVYSYGQPDTSGMTLSASRPDTSALGGSTATTVSLDLGKDPLAAIGGIGGRVQLILSGNGGIQTRTFTIRAAQSVVSTTFAGLRAGATYEATALVTSGHGGLSAPKGSVPVVASSAWPASTDQGGSLGVVANCPQSTLSCTLDISFRGLASNQVRGEHFRLAQNGDPRTSSGVTCGSQTKPLSGDGLDPGTAHIRVVLSQLELFYGTCQVRVVLIEDATGGPLVFGGVPSPVLTTDVNLGSPQSANVSSTDFAAAFDGAQASVTYTGNNALIGTLATNWRETLYSPAGANCGENTSGSAPVPGRAHTISASAACLRQNASDTGWYVRVSYDNALGGGTNGPYTVSIPTAPYGPCSPTGFQAVWQDSNSQLSVGYTGNTSAIAGCPGQSWLFTLYDPAGNKCGQPDDGTSDPGNSVTITVTCGTTPTAGWRVTLDYLNAGGAAQPSITFTADDPSG